MGEAAWSQQLVLHNSFSTRWPFAWALIALWGRSDFFFMRRTKLAALSALAVGVMGSLWLLSSYSRGLWPLLYSMLSLASAGAVTFAIWCSQSNSVFGRSFRAGWLRYMGKISYCLYLIHQPVYYVLGAKLVRNSIGVGTGATIFVMVLGFVASLAISSVSWYLFESQILRLKDRLEYHQQPPAVAAAV